METQNKKIKQHLKKGRSITAMDALKKYAIFRLASRINDLKNEGLKIKSEFISVKNRFGKLVNVKKYYL